MSIAVTLADLPAAIDQQIGWCYLLTVTDDSQPRVIAIAPTWSVGGVLSAEVGRGTAANVQARPNVTLVYPPASAADGMTLIIDGSASMDGSTVSFLPGTAVMHRPAVASGGC